MSWRECEHDSDETPASPPSPSRNSCLAAQATAKHVATIAKAFADDISSCKALKDLSRAPLNDALQVVVKRWGLTLNVPLTYTDLSNDCRVPVLLPADYIRTLRDEGYLNKLVGGSVSSSPTDLFQKGFFRVGLVM